MRRMRHGRAPFLAVEWRLCLLGVPLGPCDASRLEEEYAM